MANLFSLAGGIALVTGAGSGIGQAIALGLAEAGADVACFGHGSAGGLDGTAAHIRQMGRRSIACHGDVTHAADIDAAIDKTGRELGPLSIAVNNAGIGGAGAAETMSIEDWEHLYDVNVTGVFRCCQAQAKVMIAHGGGSIINIASMSGTIANRGLKQAHYNSSKAAVIHMTKSLATEWAGFGIRVNAISPGYTLTPMNRRGAVAGMNEMFARDTPMGRLAEASEMAGPAIFLASKASSFVTGLDLIADGGFVCW
jgi:NAD(P)-dependent dehydrogenase (short-subunit alcohol dehydrogenase family)